MILKELESSNSEREKEKKSIVDDTLIMKIRGKV